MKRLVIGAAVACGIACGAIAVFTFCGPEKAKNVRCRSAFDGLEKALMEYLSRYPPTPAASSATKADSAAQKQPPPVKFEATGLAEPKRVKPGETAVAVTFDAAAFRMVFRPPWLAGYVTANNIVCSPGYAETADAKNCDGPAEVQQDRDNRHARMWIERQSAARIVVRTRSALVDKNGVIAHSDVPSGSPHGKGDWVDERFTIYPDGTCVRAVTIHTGLAEDAAAAHWADGKTPFETQETIITNADGRAPTDDIDVNALTLIRMDGEAKTIPFKPYPAEGALHKGANIQVVNLKQGPKPFTIVPDTDPKIQAFRGPLKDHEHLGERVFVGWPRGDKWGGHYTVALSHVIDWRFHARTKNTLTSVYLLGMTSAGTDAAKAKELAPLARAWLRPPKLTVTSGGKRLGFDTKQKAYVIEPGAAADKPRIGFAIAASEASPLVNPAFVLKGWGDGPAKIKVNRQPVEPGANLRVGREKGKDRADLIVWLKMRSTWPMQFEVE